jgi:hypothetical protein
MWELLSEADHVGTQYENFINDEGKNARRRLFSRYRESEDSYGNFHDHAQFQQSIANWHDIMSSYIKNDLGDQDHLISANYTGEKAGFLDNSYYLPNIDVITYNWYSDDVDKYAQQTNVINILRNNVAITTGKTKPVFFSESGVRNYFDCSGDVEYKEDLWMSAFSGTAGPGNVWKGALLTGWQHHWQQWRNFMQGIDLENNQASVYWQAMHDERNGILPEDKSMETNYLVESNGERAVGVISNRTSNHHTRGDTFDLNGNVTPCFSDQPDELYRPLTTIFPVAAGANRLEVSGLTTGKLYFVNYFNPDDLSYLGQTWGIGPNVTLFFPILGQAKYLIAFQLHENGVDFIKSGQSLVSGKPRKVEIGSDVTTDLGDAFEWVVAPNPTSGQVRLYTEGLSSSALMEITDIRGRLIKKVEVSNGMTPIDLSTYERGVYIFRLTQNGVVDFKKIVLN